MNIFKFYKQTLAILLVSFLFVGCSNKSKSTYGDGTNNPTNQDGSGTNNDGNGTNNSDGIAGADQNVTVDTPFTVTSGTSNLDGALTYVWTEGDTQLGTDAAYTGTLGKGEHILTLTITNDKGETESDTVSIKVGKYVISRSYTDQNGDGTIDTVRIYTYDEDGKLISIVVYTNVNGEREPEKNGMTPHETVTYTYDAEGNLTGTETKDKDGNNVVPNKPTEPVTETPIKPTTTNNVDAEGNGDVTTTDDKDTKRTFTYKNGILVSGKAEYADGTTKDYTYVYDENGNWITETVSHKDTNGNVTKVETITKDTNGNVTKVEVDTDGDGIADKATTSTEYDYLFLWKYKD